ncbi:hypothetical protein SUNI508_05354 [Seiridium unicorne]|uniref:Uncharacterized protein n=1 Tax=Seiridium unicorne TaxID=138068 RepID=A0ABR2V561_9PEZI
MHRTCQPDHAPSASDSTASHVSYHDHTFIDFPPPTQLNLALDPRNGSSSRTNAQPGTRSITEQRRMQKRSISARDADPRFREALHKFFQEYAPSDKRLDELGKRPFVIRYEEPDAQAPWSDPAFHSQRSEVLYSTKYAMKSHHQLSEVIPEANHWKHFADQMSNAWPKSFGSLFTYEDQPPRFLWRTGTPPLDDGTNYICRKSTPSGDQSLLEVLFHGFNVHLVADDDVLWQVMPSILHEPFDSANHGFSRVPTCSYAHRLYQFWDDNSGDFGNGDWLCIRFNMRSCIPDDRDDRVTEFEHGYGISPKGIGLPLKRQAARIPRLSGESDQFAIEFLMSVAIVLRKRCQIGVPSIVKYNVVVWADYRNEFEERSDRRSLLPVLSDNVALDLDLRDYRPSNKIDETVGIQADEIAQLQDTLDKRRWEMLMFDDSFQLSEQYFSVLQLLRIFLNWIEEAEQGILDLRSELTKQCVSWRAWQREHSLPDEDERHLDLDNLKRNDGQVEDFFRRRVSALKDRIQRKKDEVESLRDGLFNAASLRKTLKAKTLSIYIGVFTVVTVFFTSLGFMATFWAIPFLTTGAEISVPRGFTSSFVVVPTLTYLLSAIFIIYVWSRSSRSSGGFVPVWVGDAAGFLVAVTKLASGQLGQLYQGAKSATKVGVKRTLGMRPERIASDQEAGI